MSESGAWRRSLLAWVVPALGLLCVACGSTPPASTPTSRAAPEMDLAEAVDGGDLARVRELLDRGADPDEPLVLGSTPLMRAANGDQVEILRTLLAGGADPDGTGLAGLTAVHVAARADASGALEVLLEAGADPAARSRSGMNALDHAADAGATETLRMLAGSDVVDLNGRSQVVAQGHGHPRDEGPTPLSIAVRAGEEAAVRTLLELGAAVDRPSTAGHTPLLVAVFSGQSPDLVEILLGNGADLAATATCDLGCATAGGEGADLTVVEWAEELGRTELLELFESR